MFIDWIVAYVFLLNLEMFEILIRRSTLGINVPLDSVN